jgi:hypothetical protein
MESLNSKEMDHRSICCDWPVSLRRLNLVEVRTPWCLSSPAAVPDLSPFVLDPAARTLFFFPVLLLFALGVDFLLY